MNYYERHLGDYAKDTYHLSLLENGIYTVLLDRCFSTEKPIPADQAYRFARAKTRSEKKSVDAVLDEFFVLDGGAYHSKLYVGYVEAKAKRAEANRKNGKLGGRPPKHTVSEKPNESNGIEEKETQIKPNGNPIKTQQKPNQNPTKTPNNPIANNPEEQNQEHEIPANAGIRQNRLAPLSTSAAAQPASHASDTAHGNGANRAAMRTGHAAAADDGTLRREERQCQGNLPALTSLLFSGGRGDSEGSVSAEPAFPPLFPVAPPAAVLGAENAESPETALKFDLRRVKPHPAILASEDGANGRSGENNPASEPVQQDVLGESAESSEKMPKPANAIPPCPAQQITELYNEILPELPRVNLLTEERKKRVRARWKEHPVHQDIEFWRELWLSVRHSDFLMGRTEQNGSKWTPNFDWFLKPSNFIKVVEGNYLNRR